MTVLFTAAAVWFPLTALHRRTADTAAGMAAMAWMLRTPLARVAPSHETPTEGVPARTTPRLSAALRAHRCRLPSSPLC
ncbi:hypothetical protein [Streptomyces sp. NPDC052015]|uniref:hypothetical protein n=1 Tax=Streptomyces sp. NPDC052015 TaxID=3154755 RepID=UPI00343F6EAE